MKNRKYFSVIIPTYNRKEKLEKCLKALFRQTYPRSRYEIIVVDDGSTDGTGEMVKRKEKRSPVPLHFIRQENSGPARARNVGIRKSQGDLLLITGDDIIAERTLLEEHWRFHWKYPEEEAAVLGYITWSSGISVTPFMHYLENGGPQFRFQAIEHGSEVPFRYFVTSNISLKRSFLLNHGLFDEHFHMAAFEDTELAFRLQKKGMRIIYNSNAVAYHDHASELKGVLKRMETVGMSAVVWYRKMQKNKKDYRYFFDSPHTSEKRKNLIQKILFNSITSKAMERVLPVIGNGNLFTPGKTALYNQLMYHHFRRGISRMDVSREERSDVEIFLKLLSKLIV